MLASVLGTDSGLGYAVASLQVHLGVGLVLMFVGNAVRSGGDLAKQLQGTTWEMALRAAAEASVSAPLLAAHALIQVRGGALDMVTWLGMATSTTAVVCGAATVLLGPMFGAGASRASANGDSEAHLAPPPLPRTWALSRICSALRGTGSALLLFGALPAGAQLFCAAILARVALAVHAAGAFADALALGGSLSSIVGDLERTANLAPMVSSLALLDHITVGPRSIGASAQPILYCVLASLVQVSLVLIGHASLSKSVKARTPAEFDLDFSLDPRMESSLGTNLDAVRRTVSLALYLAMAVLMFSVFQNMFNAGVSLTGLSVEWGESPLPAAACLLETLIFGVYATEFVASRLSGTSKQVSNGVQASSRTMYHLKAIVAPAQSLVLAMILMANVTDSGGKLGMMLLLPRYGFVFASMGVALQVASFLLYAMVHADDYPPKEPPFDCTGTLEEGAIGGGLGRAITLGLLQGGVSLGVVGMGSLPWVAAGLVLGPIIYLVLPAAARQGVCGTLSALGGYAMAQLGATFKFVDSFLEKRRAAQEAKQAKAAAERAAMLLEEESNSKKGKKEDKNKSEKAAPKKEERISSKEAGDEAAEGAHAEEKSVPKKKGAPKQGGKKRK